MNERNENKTFSAREMVFAAAFLALAVVLQLMDKQLTVPLNAIWPTGGSTTLVYFLPIIAIAIFMRKPVFFASVVVLVVAMYMTGTRGNSLVDFVLEYAIPLLAISSFLVLPKYTKTKKRFLVYIPLIVTLLVTWAMYTYAGVLFFGVTWSFSLVYNGTLLIAPAFILGILILPVLKICRTLNI